MIKTAVGVTAGILLALAVYKIILPFGLYEIGVHVRCYNDDTPAWQCR